ncbi:zinc ABC transporter substrate-binding protein [Aetokthonos hydrillicola Thurmond2011]|jgi:manganese/iron transport system substrate-binding protein|uniref:Zinc ABC transporter substrate-binding protein n=1 Tax=Aetokthonos hydrillicola Thurmond2011 TaxID=2712845 RepID=A0AAP5M3F3_9CYAN|nr:zinc ABC transporter substrate-binding protein [Aetokthonos hydrillicola]MBO3457425.1 zinc ABC transporter solute-binding protein [Aetokthonos hydrillicola CCALA 1050]MBW4586053.1 zinc ABC transporter substrate-binding protein [Aetokthonos hydrillicola CCALA 1050]MDR9893721.1 zinc ABC transporter substrate-binding protein [Aetokthonos hydrillicola Thurmond2011]
MYIKTNRTCKAVAFALILGLFSACGQSPPSTSENSSSTPDTSPAKNTNTSAAVVGKGLKVVATNTVLCDLTKQIAVNTVDLTCLIKAGSDPHIYQATPEDRKAIEDGKLILYGGYNFEPSLIKLIKATSNPAPKIAVDEVAVPNPQKFEEDGKVENDPHVWHNAQNGIRMVEVIESNLAKVAPENAALYTKNAKAIITEITQIDRWIKSQINTIPPASRTLVTTHDALGYYSKAYGIPVAALEGISTEEKPTAAKVKQTVETVKKAKVSTIFAELSINPKLIETVAKEANVKVSDREIFADGLGEAGSEGDTYQHMLAANTKTIVEGLGGQYTAFQLK